jgi:hypothetical protein
MSKQTRLLIAAMCQKRPITVSKETDYLVHEQADTFVDRGNVLRQQTPYYHVHLHRLQVSGVHIRSRLWGGREQKPFCSVSIPTRPLPLSHSLYHTCCKSKRLLSKTTYVMNACMYPPPHMQPKRLLSKTTHVLPSLSLPSLSRSRARSLSRAVSRSLSLSLSRSLSLSLARAINQSSLSLCLSLS